MSEETYYSRNRERCLAKVKEYQKANPGKCKEYWKAYWLKKKEILTEKRRLYEILHPRPPKKVKVKSGRKRGRPRIIRPVVEKPVKPLVLKESVTPPVAPLVVAPLVIERCCPTVRFD